MINVIISDPNQSEEIIKALAQGGYTTAPRHAVRLTFSAKGKADVTITLDDSTQIQAVCGLMAAIGYLAESPELCGVISGERIGGGLVDFAL